MTPAEKLNLIMATARLNSIPIMEKMAHLTITSLEKEEEGKHSKLSYGTQYHSAKSARTHTKHFSEKYKKKTRSKRVLITVEKPITGLSKTTEHRSLRSLKTGGLNHVRWFLSTLGNPTFLVCAEQTTDYRSVDSRCLN